MTHSMQLSRNIAKDCFVKVPTRGSPGRVQWLMYVAQEVRDPFESIRACQIRPSAQCSTSHLPNTILQYTRLVCYGTHDATTFCTVLGVVQTTVIRRPVVGVYPVPLVREASFGCMRVAVRPSCGTAY